MVNAGVTANLGLLADNIAAKKCTIAVTTVPFDQPSRGSTLPGLIFPGLKLPRTQPFQA